MVSHKNGIINFLSLFCNDEVFQPRSGFANSNDI